MAENKILQMHPAETFPDKIKEEQTFQKSGSGGGSNMDKYVTHEELKLTEEKLSNKIDTLSLKIDTKFADQNTKLAEQETKFFKNMIVIASISLAAIGLMIKFL